MWIKYKNDYCININNLSNIYISGTSKISFVYAERIDIRFIFTRPKVIELFSGTKEECDLFYNDITKHIAESETVIHINRIFEE